MLKQYLGDALLGVGAPLPVVTRSTRDDRRPTSGRARRHGQNLDCSGQWMYQAGYPDSPHHEVTIRPLRLSRWLFSKTQQDSSKPTAPGADTDAGGVRMPVTVRVGPERATWLRGPSYRDGQDTIVVRDVKRAPRWSTSTTARDFKRLTFDQPTAWACRAAGP